MQLNTEMTMFPGASRALRANGADINTLSIGVPLPLGAASTRAPSRSQGGDSRKRRRLGTLYVTGRNLFERPREKENDSVTEAGSRKRKLSEAQDVAVRVRERWATLEKLTAAAPGQRTGKENAPMALGDRQFATGAHEDENTARSDQQPSTSSGTVAEQASDKGTKHGEHWGIAPAFLNESSRPVVPEQPSRTSSRPMSPIPRPIPRSTPRIRRPGIISKELESYEMEAMEMVMHAPPGRGRFPCTRAGCHDVLASVEGLARHLHMHDIVPDAPELRLPRPRDYVCESCTGAYDTSRELLMHDCLRHRESRSSQKRRFSAGGLMHALKLSKLNCFGPGNVPNSPPKRPRRY